MIDIVELTRELVMIPSESSDPAATPAAAEAGVARRLRELCRSHHVSCETLTAKEGRDNLVVRWRAPGRPRLLIMAHMDTVSARGMNEPFAARLENGRIHGRGACDDKGPLACAFATVVGLIHKGARPRFDLTLAATVDEEVSMAGATALAASGGPWDLAIALEPTSLKVITAHKGACRFRITTSGRAAHSSVPERGDNAVYKMLPVIEALRAYGDTLTGSREDPDLGRPSLAVTRISGGSSLNIIPDACEIGVDIRILPGMEPDDIAAEVERAVAGRGRVEELYRGEGMKTDPETPLVRDFLAALEKSGVAAETITAPFATDCSRLAHLCPCLVWGPGDIRLAHQTGEHIDTDELVQAARVLEGFLVER